MTKALREEAQKDTQTPSDVFDTWPKLIVWAIGNLGPGVVIALGMAAVTSLALKQVYGDNRALMEKMMGIIEKKAETDAASVEAQRQISDGLRSIAQDARDAHTRFEQEQRRKTGAQ